MSFKIILKLADFSQYGITDTILRLIGGITDATNAIKGAFRSCQLKAK
jgi:hypothetical protein